ncbi:MAG: NUDIX domain-containing protein [Clostridia bacterium]|nr:NUDIX domain-containing protein [Clostridia bacterium]
MPVEKSCGAVVFTYVDGEPKFVIIRSPEGFYGFPKGHVEDGETEEQTALREIFEETGLRVRLIDGFRTEDSHPLIREGRPDVIKTIVYFLAEFDGQALRAQESEVSEISLMSYEKAMSSFQFESSKRILSEAFDFLNRR